MLHAATFVHVYIATVEPRKTTKLSLLGLGVLIFGGFTTPSEITYVNEYRHPR